MTSGGGIYNGGTLNFANTIIANSTRGLAGSGSFGTNQQPGGRWLLLPLVDGDPLPRFAQDNGGPTQTLALILTSPAIDAGDDTTCAASPVNKLDQRGVTRPDGAHCDIGAYEGTLDITAPTVEFVHHPSSSTSLDVPITEFTASDNLAVTGYLVTELDTPPAAGAAGWTASAPSTYTFAGGGNYTLYPWAKDAGENVSAASRLARFGHCLRESLRHHGHQQRRQRPWFVAPGPRGCLLGRNHRLQRLALRRDNYPGFRIGSFENVTIDGSSLASKITISGNNSTRVFYVGSAATATLDSLIVTQGRVEGCCGAGLLNYGALTITNSLFSANINNNGVGGAIMNIAPAP